MNEKATTLRDRRRFMLLCGAVALAILAVVECKAATSLDGEWRGTGRYAFIRMAVKGDKIVFTNRVGPRASLLSFPGPEGRLVIHSVNGVQHGVYEIDDNRLRLRLSNVGAGEPESVDTSQKGTMLYSFERVPKESAPPPSP